MNAPIKSRIKVILASIIVGICLLILLSVPSLKAQAIQTEGSPGGWPKMIIRAAKSDNPPPPILPPSDFLENTPQAATINVTYTGSWEPQAQTAFEYAADIWETMITSTVPIEIVADWAPLGGAILGKAGPAHFLENFDDAPLWDTWYPISLANSFAEMDLDPTGPDIEATMNSARSDWYFGTDGNTPTDKYDFVSLALHEIAHGLGYIGSMSVGDAHCNNPDVGCWGAGILPQFPFVYDHFTENGIGQSLLSFQNYSTQLAAQLTSDDVFFDGPMANSANGGELLKLYNPSPWSQGSSYSHLDEATYNEPENALMTPDLDLHETRHLPGNVTLGMFADMGWVIAWPGSEPTPAIIEHCDPIDQNETWIANGVIHVVTCDVTIPSGLMLTVEGGAIVKLRQHADIIVDGKLAAQGMSDSPTYFTSYYDDTIGGDTDGTAIAPQVEDWGQIRFNSGSDDTSVISRTVIRYSGRDYPFGPSDGAIWLSNASPEISYITFEDNYINGVQLQSGIAWQTDTWDNTTVVYVIEGGELTIPALNTLTVSPGMQVKLTPFSDIFIDGRLVASGTITNPVYFTSFLDDEQCGLGAFNEAICDTHNDGVTAPSVANWGHIRFNSGSDDTSVISRAVIRYSGQDWSAGGPPDGAIWLSNASPELSYITFEDNYINGVQLQSGIAWQTDTWDNTTVVYVIEGGDLTVPALNTLSFSPGMQVKFNQHVDINVDGRLFASGTITNPIFFTSILDDGQCGLGAFNEAICDTNNDGVTAPSVENWGQIRFNSGSDDTSVISRAVIRYSGRDYPFGPSDGAIWLSNASPTVSFTAFTHNFRAIEVFGGSTPELECNDFEDISNFAIYNDTPQIVVTAEDHWWGHPSGPTHVNNPGGIGEPVSDGVDYEPWADQPCVLPWAAFTAAPTSGSAPLTVTFSNTSSGYTSSLWSFGDGITSTLESPTHTYALPGIYDVVLTINGPLGTDTETKNDYIAVYEVVVANFSGTPVVGSNPLTVTFTNLSTGDFDTCLWDFGDGSSSSDCNDPSNTYLESGIYTVSLTTSGLGGADTKAKQDYIIVYEHVVADFSGVPISGTAPLTVTLTNLSTGDFDTCLWDFGDGNSISDCSNQSHTYSTPGIYDVSLIVTGLGGTDTETKINYIAVYEEVVADFSGAPTEGLTPLTVVFSNLSTGDYSTCAWDFGDGSFSSDCNDPSHTYSVGTFTVTLKVDGLGSTDINTRVGYIEVFPRIIYLPVMIRP